MIRLAFALLLSVAVRMNPSPTLTPGATCSARNPDLVRVERGVAYCRRHVTEATRRRVLRAYGVSWSDRNLFEMDHLVPLCAGGSNDVRNLWPEPLADAARKDALEHRVCAALRAGRIDQTTAVRAFAPRAAR